MDFDDRQATRMIVMLGDTGKRPGGGGCEVRLKADVTADGVVVRATAGENLDGGIAPLGDSKHCAEGRGRTVGAALKALVGLLVEQDQNGFLPTTAEFLERLQPASAAEGTRWLDSDYAQSDESMK